MTAMMMLCLVVMAVTMVAIQRELHQKTSGDDDRSKEIGEVCSDIQGKLKGNSEINVNCIDYRMDFGDAGRFNYKDYHLRP